VATHDDDTGAGGDASGDPTTGASVRAGYDRWAAGYDGDRNLTRDLDARVTRTALAALRPASILELGCGTGKNTAFLAGFGVPILALDFSAAMLARARARGLPGVAFAVADLTEPWPCADASADLIVGNLVLEHIADLGHIFAEAAQCLMPGGTLFVGELHPFRQYLGARANFAHGGGRVAIPAFVHHLSDFTNAAARAGLTLTRLDEWWHDEDDAGKPPRLVSLLWGRGSWVVSRE
jgi:SAM-dependent methyltransferase